jgi:tetratricopeptide (TPR) repeat protein
MSAHPGQAVRPIHILRRNPASIPALGALALFVVWAGSEAGYPVTHWAPGALILLALVGITLGSVPLRLREVPLAVRVAVACLALYTALSFLSILWAHVPADAWEGANRTLLYLLVFALFALWPQRGASAALLLCAWTLALTVLAFFVLLHVNGAAHPASLFSEGRLKYPSDYENACAAIWCMALWPALLLSTAERLHWSLRGVLAGAAVLLADLALLSQSRGSLYTTAIMLVLVFAVLPWRVRLVLVLAPVAVAIGASAPIVLRVGDRLKHGGDVPGAMHTATVAILAAALVAAAVVAIGAAVERRASIGEALRGRLHRAVGIAAIAGLVVAIAGGAVAAGDPVARVEHAWHTFKGDYGANNAKVNRLVGGFGSGRYDFYRVALDEFVAHPVLGIGADNFAEQYLARGHETETPHYPHSVELRTLVQTGLLGAAIALIGLAAALIAAFRAAISSLARRVDPLAATTAAAALAGFAYWLVHGSFDWFWEFAGLGAPAFALLGLACSLGPRGLQADAVTSTPGAVAASARATRGSGEHLGHTPRSVSRRRLGIAGVAAVAVLACALSLVAPWLSQLQVENAAQIWPTAPRKAYADLNDAARLNPLSDQPYLVAGSIALRFGDLARADREFARALTRTPRDAYALLERGAIASARGHRTLALALLRRTVELNPNDELTHAVLRVVREGRRVSVEGLNRSILLSAQHFA